MTPAQWNEYERQAQVIERHQKWKEQQKQIITEIMDLDAKDGLYEDDVKKLAEDWCKSIGEDGFVNSGDDYDIHELPAFIAGVKWYREQLKNIDKKL